MLINWFTVAAQIVNFLILVALLKHFLYDRIIQAMDEREEMLNNRMKEAEHKEEEAARKAESFYSKQRKLEEEQEQLMSEAREKAENQRKELLDRAREEVDAQRKNWEASLRREENSFMRDLQQMAGREVYEVARSVIRDLAGADPENSIVGKFIERLESMKEEETEEMRRALKDSGRGLIVKSRFDIPPKNKQRLTSELHNRIGKGVEVNYETDSEMLPGIEIKGYGLKMSWSTGDYLDSLENRAKSFLSQVISEESDQENGLEQKGEDEN